MKSARLIDAVSVVIPHYGDPAHADSLVCQLMSQVGAPEFEIIVVDDASPQPYPDDERVRLVRRGRNGGFGAAVNSGVAQARHPYLLILNSDLSVGATFVADLCTAAEPFQPAVVGPMVVGHDGASQWAGRKFPRASHYFVEWLTILARYKDTRWRHAAIGHDVRCVAGVTQPVDWVMGAAMLIPTVEFRAAGGFDEAFHMNCEEVDLQRRLRDRGVPSVFAGSVAVTHFGGASSGGSHRRRSMLMNSRVRYAKKWHQHPGLMRASLVGASAVNLASNAARRATGRDVHPVADMQAELAALAVRRRHDAESSQARPLRVAFLTPWPIDDDRSWSGVIQPMLRALSTVADVVPISTRDVKTAFPDRVAAKLLGKQGRKKYLWEFGIANAWKRSRVASRRVRAANVDVVLAAAASVDVAFARFRRPVVQVADATLKRILGFYPMFTGLSWISSLQAKVIAMSSTRRTDRFLATSQWAADSLVQDYGVSVDKCVVAPLGPAIEPASPPRHDNHGGPLRVLVVAADWERKRGDTCVEAVAAARGRGLSVELRIVGDAPVALPSWAKRLGQLTHAELSEIYLDSDVLLDLSVATAASVVATDAAAHGLPVIALDTGGMSSIVVDGQTGYLIHRSTDEFRDAAQTLLRISEGDAPQMSSRAIERAGQNLSWNSWSRVALAHMADVAGRAGTSSPRITEPMSTTKK